MVRSGFALPNRTELAWHPVDLAQLDRAPAPGQASIQPAAGLVQLCPRVGVVAPSERSTGCHAPPTPESCPPGEGKQQAIMGTIDAFERSGGGTDMASANARRVGWRAVFAQAEYRRLWSARTVSQWGDVFATVALALPAAPVEVPSP